MEDRLLAGLKLAELYWKKSELADKPLKIEFAKQLNGHEMFSLNQLAKIVRLNPRELSGKLESMSGGGRFEPECLGALISMRQLRLLGEPIKPRLIELVVNNGTSYSCAVELTGIPYSTYYKHVPPKNTAVAVEKVTVSEETKAGIILKREAGWKVQAIADHYNLGERTVYSNIPSELKDIKFIPESRRA